MAALEIGAAERYYLIPLLTTKVSIDMASESSSNDSSPHPYATYVAIAVALVALQTLVLYLFGQPPISTDGQVKLWEGEVLSAGNSQHLSDWYTFSHIIHGLLFYGLAWVIFRKQSVGVRFLMAVGLEAGWEVLENTPMVINHYRQQALAQGYTGDSILNSVSDNVSMMLGFLVAWRLPVWAVVVFGLSLELFAAFMIRDNLTLNVINLVYPFEFIADWQSAA